MASSTLFCIPYAGGIAEVTYAKWQAHLGKEIRVVPLEPPGHGRRMNEAFASSIEATALDFLPKIADVAGNGSPYAIYAHSMGTLIAYELCKAIKRKGLPDPEGMFISGRLTPEHQYGGPDLHRLSDEELIASLMKIDGTPLQLFNMPKLMEAFLPIIRSDYRITEIYNFKEPRHAIEGAMHCFFSDSDALVNLEDMQKWKKYANGPFHLHKFSGHHFFINDHYVAICDIIKRALHQAVVCE